MQENKANSTQIYAISDGRAGNVRQAEALVGALATDFTALTLQPHLPWRWVAPRRWPGAERAFGDAFSALLDTPPAIAIGCGRQAALATRLLRERGAKVVQILDPRLDPKRWDLIVVPEHDRLRGPNVITSLGSLQAMLAFVLTFAGLVLPWALLAGLIVLLIRNRAMKRNLTRLTAGSPAPAVAAEPTAP